MANVVNPKVPKALAEIAARAIEKDPEHRFRSARALSRELRHWIEEHGHAFENDGAATPRRGPMLLAAALLVGVIAAGVAWWATSHKAAPAVVAAVTAAPAAAVVAPAPAVSPPPAVAGPASEALSAIAAPVAVEPAATAVNTNPAPPVATAAVVTKDTKPAAAPKETARERRVREAKERAAAAAPLPTGTLRLAVSPWGQVEVDGAPMGSAPPLNELTLPEGRHQIIIRNEDFPPYSASVTIAPGQPVTLKHKFGT
jgi:serine/threonine-protein kinase